jgi:predicted DCC family thiol-disulfide oxidoreductase YuxK
MDLNDELGGRLLVVYDGHCGLCNHSVHWLLRRDSHDRLRFVASQSEKIAAVLMRHGFTDSVPQLELPADPRSATISTFNPNTILVLCGIGTEEEQLLTRSDAILAILRELPQPWPAAATALRPIPRPLRDLGYRIIARSRYRIWGRMESCPIPTTPAERAHFL